MYENKLCEWIYSQAIKKIIIAYCAGVTDVQRGTFSLMLLGFFVVLFQYFSFPYSPHMPSHHSLMAALFFVLASNSFFLSLYIISCSLVAAETRLEFSQFSNEIRAHFIRPILQLAVINIPFEHSSTLDHCFCANIHAKISYQHIRMCLSLNAIFTAQNVSKLD